MIMTWHKTGYAPDLLCAWLCDAGEHELVVLQHTAVRFSAAVRDLTGQVLISLQKRFQTWTQAALWAEAQAKLLRAKEKGAI